jgi:hypothetical protein
MREQKKSLRLGHGLFIASILFIFFVTGFFIPYKNAITSPISVNQITNKLQGQRDLLSLPPLTVNSSLMSAAQSQAEDMARSGTFAYSMPDGATSWDYIKKSRVIYSSAAMLEAISDESSDRIIAIWSNSPIKYDAYTDRNYTDIGVGVANLGDYQGHQNAKVIIVFLTNQQQQNQNLNEIPTGGVTLLSPWYFKINTNIALTTGFVLLLFGTYLEIRYIKKLHK